jgi:ABC-type multidrug transport system fused ATPase/permease subunit
MRNHFDILGDIYSLAPGKKLQIIGLFVSDMLYNLATLLPPIATSGIIALLTENGEFSSIWFYVALYIIFYFFQFAFLEWNYHIYVDLSHHYYNTVQQRLFDHIAENDGILEKIGKGKITDTCSEDVSYIVLAVDQAADCLTGIIQLVAVFFIFASHNIVAAFAALLIDLVYLHRMNNNSKMVAKHYEGTRKYQDKIIDVLNQMLGSLKQVKSLNIMPKLTKRLDKTRKSYDQQYDRKYVYLTSRYCRIPMIVYIGKIILYIFLSYLVLDNKMTLDKLVLLISYFETVITSTDSILEQFLNLSHNEVRINRIKHILNFSNETTEMEFGDVDNDYINGVVTFDHVNYDMKNKKILKNVSFKALPNEITAIIGRPGAGKTTIINLLYRLGRVKSGSILIDDESIYNYTKKVYSSNVSGVFQKSFAFKMSIRDNLSLVDSDLNRQIAAMKRVGIYKDIERLPYGINTIIDEENQILSDGQLKKLAIARALLSRAEILLFDEVTSNIDPASTADVINILNDLREDHTIIIITHKASIMQMADQIVVLDHGKVVAKGRNAEVFEKSALYRELRTSNFAEPSVNNDFVEKTTDSLDGGYINDAENTKTAATKLS